MNHKVPRKLNLLTLTSEEHEKAIQYGLETRKLVKGLIKDDSSK